MKCSIAIALITTVLVFHPAANAEPAAAISIKRLTLESVLAIGKAAIDHCREQGVSIGVVIVDRGGRVQLALRDTVAADLTLRIAEQKAYTALSFNVPGSELGRRAASPLGWLDGLMMLAGSLPVHAGGEIYGAIGVSGAPSGIIDEDCAQVGLEAVLDELELG